MFGSSRPLRVQIKICGITNLSDATDAIRCGADALGFNLFPGSRRFIEIEASANWISQIPSEIRKVAVLVNPTWDEAVTLARLPFFDSLQLHGGESPEFCRKLAEHGIAFTKALPMDDEASLQQQTDFGTRSFLLDSKSAKGFGGTGQIFPWSLARRFIDAHPDIEVILAGGLTPENVGQAIVTVRPAGVDVTSGVEASFGRKDHALLKAFISAAEKA
jgi:phosphoribosylanthranilate isomerase